MREATKTHEEIPPLSYDPAHIHRGYGLCDEERHDHCDRHNYYY